MSLKRQTAFRVASATYRQLRASDRAARIKLLAQVWMAMAGADGIPERYPSEIWPGIESVTAQVRLHQHHYELAPAEQAVIDALVRFKAPRTIFEFGTYAGASTVLLADAAPEGATVHTVDVPDDLLATTGWFNPEIVGREFKTKPRYEGKILQHRAHLARFDVTPFRSAVDLVFVDDGHSYEDVSRDSQLALDMLAPGGCIIWDDYAPPHSGAIRALNELSEHVPLLRIRQTRLVAYQATS